MAFTLEILVLALALLGGMLVLMEVGRRLGRRHRDRHPGAHTAMGPVEGAVFGLLGLVVAFTFSGAASRFDARRQLIAQEANAIGTAYLRLDLLSGPDRARAQAAMKDYLDARIAYYGQVPESPGARAMAAGVQARQDGLWTLVLEACARDSRPHVTMLLVPALNDMLDITTTRDLAANLHPPGAIIWMLYLLAGAGALVAGYAGAEAPARSWLHHLGFALIFAGTVFVVLDLEHPRRGLIRLTSADRLLVDLRARMR